MTPLKFVLSLLNICAVYIKSISSESSHNFECASIYLSDNKTTVQILDSQFIDKNKFEDIRVGKLEAAKFSVTKYAQDEKNCLLEICGYSRNPTSPYYYGNCQWYNSSSDGEPIEAPPNIYKTDYELCSTSCSCTSPSSNCSSDNCFAKFAAKNWKDDECAVLFQEKNCTTCHFPLMSLSRNKWIYTLNSYQFRSMIIRPGCMVEKVIKVGLDRNKDWITNTETFSSEALIVVTTGAAFHKDTENFTCYCDNTVTDSSPTTSSDNFSSTLEYASTDTTVGSSSVTTESTSETSLPINTSSEPTTVKATQNSKLSAVHYIIISGSVVILIAVVGYLLRYYNRKRKCQMVKQCEAGFSIVADYADIDSSPSSSINLNTGLVQSSSSGFSSGSLEMSEYSTQTAYSLETRDDQILDIRNEIKLINSLIPSTDKYDATISSTFKDLLKLNQIYHPQYDISRDSFWISKRNLETPLGSGQFGIVYKGCLKNKTDGLEKFVAVKKISWHSDSGDKIVKSFIQEVKTFHAIDNGNENIVGYIGSCCHSDGLYVLTQYCELGSLKSYLSRDLGPKIMSEQNSLQASEFTFSVNGDYFEANKVTVNSIQNQTLSLNKKYLRQIFRWCEQIACGMEYLGTKGIIHVDLATRNILLCSSRLVDGEDEYDIKICDFGLSKRYLDRENYAKSLLSGDFPFNSFAPECVSDKPKQISTYLDVWAYGCTLWEIFMLGDSLYPDVTEGGIHKFLAVKKLLQEGYKHPKPPLAPDHVYNEAMLKCWEYVPRNRPNFTELCNFFKVNGVNLKERLLTTY